MVSSTTLPPRHSDIYITDVYNMTEQVDRTSIGSVDKISRDSIAVFKQVGEVAGEFLEPALLLPPVPSSTNTSTESLGSLVPVKSSLRLDVTIDYLVANLPTGNTTLNELLSIRCNQVESTGVTKRQADSSGGLGDASNSGVSETWPVAFTHPPVTTTRLQHSRFSHASTSSGSSIASSASALARKIVSQHTQQPPLTEERIKELEDKWSNSIEVWRLLDFLDRHLIKHCQTSGTPPPWSQSLEQITEVATPETRRVPKVKFEDQQQQSLGLQTPRKRQRKTSNTENTNGHEVTTDTESINIANSFNYNGGERVFAKWTDRKFYAAILKDRQPDGKWIVDFYDGRRRTLGVENILRADMETLMGQRVYAAYYDGVFAAGIVTCCEPDSEGRFVYTVARDRDRDICVSAEQLMLTEVQARQVRSRNCAVSSTVNDYEMLTPGRTTRSRTRALARDSPQPSSSGTAQQRRAAGGQNANITSDSEDDTTIDFNTSTCNGFDMYVAGLEPEQFAAYDDCDRVKGKTLVGKIRFGRACPEDTAALGPLPPTGCQPFKGLHVLLSCVQPLPWNEPIVPSSTCSDVESCSSFKENYRFSTSPCMKSRLQEQLVAGGAVVYAQFDDLPQRFYKQAYIISNRPSRSASYVLSLAAGVRSVCHEWVIRCCAEGRQLPPQDLPCGWSMEKERYISMFERPMTGTNSGRPLRRKLVFVSQGSEPSFARYWTRVLELSDANVRPLAAASDSDLNRALCILCEGGYHDERTERASQRGVPLATPIWLIQTLVHGELRDFNRLSCYRADVDSD